jgi:hypothetical protein
MGYARVRPELVKPELQTTWLSIPVRGLDGRKQDWAFQNEWVKAVCFDAMDTGLYVLTDDDDYYCVAHSIDLEFSDTLPEGVEPLAFELTEMEMN